MPHAGEESLVEGFEQEEGEWLVGAAHFGDPVGDASVVESALFLGVLVHNQ